MCPFLLRTLILTAVLVVFLPGWPTAQEVPPPGKWVKTMIPLVCAEYDTATKDLRSKSKETRKAVGVSPDGKILMELWLSEGGKTFTLLVVNTHSLTCGIMGGENWHTIED